MEGPAVVAEIFQLDPRRTLPFVHHSEGPSPVAEVRTRGVPVDEDHLGAPAYLMVHGNHMAVIESAGLRTPHLANYLNTLLQSAGRLTADESWKLVPKIEVAEGTQALAGGISSFEVRPIARLVGDAATLVERRARRQAARPNPKREEKLARGQKVLDILETLGASNAELGDLRAGLSTDLGLEAKVIISVRRDARGTPATLSSADISQAVASLEEENTVTVVSPDGKQRGSLVSLAERSEIAEDGGLLSLRDVAAALSRALRGWAARGIIDLQQA